MIREGTAARNLEALTPLLDQPVRAIAACSAPTTSIPNDLLEKGHIDYIVKKAISLGVDPIIAVEGRLPQRRAVLPAQQPRRHRAGLSRRLRHYRQLQRLQYRDGLSSEASSCTTASLRDVRRAGDRPVSRAAVRTTRSTSRTLTAGDFSDERPHAVIGMVPGEIVSVDGGYADHIDTAQDILKIAVIERHKNTHHIGLRLYPGLRPEARRGCHLHLATTATTSSSSARSEEDMAAAANRIVENRGGITVVEDGAGARRGGAADRGHHVRRQPRRWSTVPWRLRRTTAFASGRQPWHRPVHDAELHGAAGDPEPAHHHARRVRCEYAEIRVKIHARGYGAEWPRTLLREGDFAAFRAFASFAGLRHFTPRRVFFAAYTPPRKTDWIFFAPCAARTL